MSGVSNFTASFKVGWIPAFSPSVHAMLRRFLFMNLIDSIHLRDDK